MKTSSKNQKVIRFHRKGVAHIEALAKDLLQEQNNIKEAMVIYLDNEGAIHYHFTHITSFTRMLGFLEYLKYKLLQE